MARLDWSGLEKSLATMPQLMLAFARLQQAEEERKFEPVERALRETGYDWRAVTQLFPGLAEEYIRRKGITFPIEPDPSAYRGTAGPGAAYDVPIKPKILEGPIPSRFLPRTQQRFLEEAEPGTRIVYPSTFEQLFLGKKAEVKYPFPTRPAYPEPLGLTRAEKEKIAFQEELLQKRLDAMEALWEKRLAAQEEKEREKMIEQRRQREAQLRAKFMSGYMYNPLTGRYDRPPNALEVERLLNLAQGLYGLDVETGEIDEETIGTLSGWVSKPPAAPRELVTDLDRMATTLFGDVYRNLDPKQQKHVEAKLKEMKELERAPKEPKAPLARTEMLSIDDELGRRYLARAEALIKQKYGKESVETARLLSIIRGKDPLTQGYKFDAILGVISELDPAEAERIHRIHTRMQDLIAAGTHTPARAFEQAEKEIPPAEAAPLISPEVPKGKENAVRNRVRMLMKERPNITEREIHEIIERELREGKI